MDIKQFAAQLKQTSEQPPNLLKEAAERARIQAGVGFKSRRFYHGSMQKRSASWFVSWAKGDYSKFTHALSDAEQHGLFNGFDTIGKIVTDGFNYYRINSDGVLIYLFTLYSIIDNEPRWCFEKTGEFIYYARKAAGTNFTDGPIEDYAATHSQRLSYGGKHKSTTVKIWIGLAVAVCLIPTMFPLPLIIIGWGICGFLAFGLSRPATKEINETSVSGGPQPLQPIAAGYGPAASSDHLQQPISDDLAYKPVE